jgi:hypothetical protein
MLLGIIIININALAQTNLNAVIEFEESTIDYGTIEKGADGVRIFKFINSGNTPLVINNVKASCGCTIPKKPNKPILPGDSGEIEVKYDTRRVMPFKKTISVSSNAVNSTVLLTIKGKVEDNSQPIINKKKSKSLIKD